MSYISSVNGPDADNAPQTIPNPVATGGKAVDAPSYAPAYTVGDAVQAAYDITNGGKLVLIPNLDETLDSVTAYMAAGTNLIGKVGIDQTTPGTTNGVAVIIPVAATDTWSNADSTAVATNKVAKASAGILRSITGYNSGPAQWIQVHNTTSLPADTAVPIVVFLADANSNFNYDAPREGRWFSTGITVCNSSTLGTKTIGAADCWFNINYK